MIREIIAASFLIIGFLLMVLSTVGAITLNDFYKRIHASGVGESLGYVTVTLGLVVYEGFSMTSLKMILIIIGLFIINTVGIHLIANAAYEGEMKDREDEDASSIH